MTIIEIYPKVPKPPWVKVGVKCLVRGEGPASRFTITRVFPKLQAVGLDNSKGFYHGLESFDKLEEIL